METPHAYILAKPDPDRDAPFAFAWFSAPTGKDTLLKMGNPENTIKPPTLEGERATLVSFIELEKARKQITWMIRADDKTIGAVWIDLHATKYLKAPSVHIMIGDTNYRGRGIGKSVMREMVEYARNTLKVPTLYSRHLASNTVIDSVNRSIGFVNDGEVYQDKDGLLWQNVKVDLFPSPAT